MLTWGYQKALPTFEYKAILQFLKEDTKKPFLHLSIQIFRVIKEIDLKVLISLAARAVVQ